MSARSFESAHEAVGPAEKEFAMQKLRAGADLARDAVAAAFQLLVSQAVEHTGPRRRLRRLGSGCTIEKTVSFRSAEQIEIGNRVVIGPFSVIWASANARLIIEDEVLLGPHVTLLTANHGIRALDRPIREQPQVEREIRIGRGAWLGAQAVVLPGVTIGEGAVVAAGAVVNRDVRPFAIVGGVPARPLGSRLPKESAAAGSERTFER
jgi:acetyltransferase-like isoleucine patch superfamily enzyme